MSLSNEYSGLISFSIDWFDLLAVQGTLKCLLQQQFESNNSLALSLLCGPALTYVGFPDSSVGKESTCNAGDPGSMPGLGRFPREGIGYPLPVFFSFRGGSDSKEFACNAGDLGSIPGLGRSPGGGHGNHSSILAWRIPWTEESGRLQSMGSQRVRHD